MRLQLFFASCFLLTTQCQGHVQLVYPPARQYALDFLDSARTVPPCGMARGNGPTTNLKAGSTFTVSWYLGYAHDGGFRLELLTYDGAGNVNKTIPLSNDGFAGTNIITATSYNVTLPAQVTSCYNCSIRLVRQALNWGPNYLFWSCADVNILPVSQYVAQCSGKGTYNPTNNSCSCRNTFSGSDCQFADECNVDGDCGSHGRCKRITDYSYPQKQCFCEQGWFGHKCQNVSTLSSVEFDPALYQHVVLSTSSELHMYYRMLQSSRELEIVLKGRTRSYLAVGWKPRNDVCVPYSLRHIHRGSDSAEPEPGSEPEPQPEPGPQGTQSAVGTTATVVTSKTRSPLTTATAAPRLTVTTEPTAEPEGNPSRPDHQADVNGMDCTDIVIGGVIGKLSRILDYYTADRSTPRQDEFYGGMQSLTAAVGEETDDGMTTIVFRRPLTANERTDHSIRNEPMTVIWAHGQAYGDTHNVADFYRPDELKYHARHRGMTSLNFYESSQQQNPPGSSVSGRQGTWSYPNGCTAGVTCSYRAVWSLDSQSDIVTFTVTAKQPANTWTGIAFAPEPKMKNMDVYIGFIDSSNRGVVIDGWTEKLYEKPVRDSVGSTFGSSVSYDAGVYTMAFQRRRTTGDTKDWQFTDADCAYFLFPVDGGLVNNGDISQHKTTPIISTNKICITNRDSSTSSVSSQTGAAGRSFITGRQIVVTGVSVVLVLVGLFMTCSSHHV